MTPRNGRPGRDRRVRQGSRYSGPGNSAPEAGDPGHRCPSREGLRERSFQSSSPQASGELFRCGEPGPGKPGRVRLPRPKRCRPRKQGGLPRHPRPRRCGHARCQSGSIRARRRSPMSGEGGQSDGVVDRVLRPAAARRRVPDHADAEATGVDGRDEACAAARTGLTMGAPAEIAARGSRESRSGRPGCATMRANAGGGAGVKGGSGSPAVFGFRRDAGQEERLTAEGERHLARAEDAQPRPSTLRCTRDLDRVAGRVAEALVHFGEQRHVREPGAEGDVDDAASQSSARSASA